MSVKRDWNVPIDLPERVGARDYTPVDPTEEQQAFLDAATILRHMGGGLIVQTVRVPVGDGRYITIGYQFRHDSYVPAVQHEEDEDEPVESEALEAEPVT